jgi:hypothetical protein
MHAKIQEAPPASLFLQDAMLVHFLAVILASAYQLLGVCLGFHFGTQKRSRSLNKHILKGVISRYRSMFVLVSYFVYFSSIIFTSGVSEYK